MSSGQAQAYDDAVREEKSARLRWVKENPVQTQRIIDLASGLARRLETSQQTIGVHMDRRALEDALIPYFRATTQPSPSEGGAA